MILLDRMTGEPVLPLQHRASPMGPAQITSIDTDAQIVRITLPGYSTDSTCDPEFIGCAFYASAQAFPR